MGKKRSFGRGLLLAIVTLGIYSMYWGYKAFKEIYDQEGRQDFPVGKFILLFVPLVNLVVVFLYYPETFRALGAARVRVGLAQTMSGGKFVGFYFLGMITLYITTILAYKQAQEEINAYWDAVSRGAVLAPSAPAPSLPVPAR